MGRRGVVPDEVGSLLHAAGSDDIEAFAAFYDCTAPPVFRFLCHALEESTAVEQTMVQVYLRVWRTASSFDPARTSGRDFLMQAVSRELDRRHRSWPGRR